MPMTPAPRCTPPSAAADLVVVGGGIAALSAALEARHLGLDVLLVCKKKPGRSGNSMVAAGNFSVCRGEADRRGFGDDIRRGGAGICEPALVRRLAAESGAVVGFLESAGVRFARRGEELAWKRIPGHSVARSVSTERDAYPMATAGLSVTLPLRAAAEAAGVRVLEEAPVVQLLAGDGRVGGVVAVPAGGPAVAIRAGGTILATGGYAGLFAHSSNTGDATGDGLALAWRAGASLRDLEFVQFHPTRALRPIRAILPTTLFDDGAVLRNRLGERFLPAATGLEDRDVPRDRMARAVVAEVEQERGLNGGVLLDLSGVPEEVGRTQFRRLWQALRRRGSDPARDPVVVGVAPHFAMGGVWIDDGCAADVAGLYAAGEVAGGVHGANRLGGDALTEAVAMGRVAARSAAGAAVTGRKPLSGGEMASASPAAGRELRRELRGVLWQAAGVTRSAAQLRAGLSRVAELAGRGTTGSAADSPFSGALDVARLVLEAALRREETRGAHARSDFPETRDGWRGSLLVGRKPGGEPAFRFVPAAGGGPA